MDWPLDIEDNESTSGLCEDEPPHSLSKMTAKHDTAAMSNAAGSIGDTAKLSAPLKTLSPTIITCATDDPGHEHDATVFDGEDTNSVNTDKH